MTTRPAAITVALSIVLIAAGCGGPGASPAGTGTPDGTSTAATAEPTEGATTGPTAAGTAVPTAAGTAEPTAAGTAEPTGAGTAEPTGAGTAEPTTAAATEAPTPVPTPGVACGESGTRELTVMARGAGVGADEIATTRYDVFCEQNPDVKLTLSNQEFDARTFQIDVASGVAPDVVRMDRKILGQYIASGILDPLDQCIADHQIDMSQYYPASVAAVTFNGQVYGIPEFFNSLLIMINDSVIQEVGLTPEDIDTSDWDALTEINQQLLAKDGDEITRIGFDPKLPEFLPLWALANGAKLVSDDGLTSQLEDPKIAEALDYAASLILAHGSSADFFDFRMHGPGSAFFGEENQFTEDSLGAFPIEAFYLNVVASDTPDEVVQFQPFRARDGSEIAIAGGSAWAIQVNAKNKDDACEFMKSVTSAEAWIAAARARAEARAAAGEQYTGTYSGNSVADETIFGELANEETAGRSWPGVDILVRGMPNAYEFPPIPGGAEFERAWQDAVRRVLEEGVPASEALGDADAEAQAAIDAERP
jgi:multiple sugar transport system substrate-binding protein